MDTIFWIYLAVLPILVLINGLIAGLTLGLLSLDGTKLQVFINSGTNKQKLAATRIAPLRKNTHLLLATLLLGNTIINETLPILLHGLVSNDWIAILISVFLVLTFAELLPQALCTHYGLQIGSIFAWFVYIIRFLFYPIAYPLGKILDWMLGSQQGALYKKAELKEFVTLHGQIHGGDLTNDEVTIVQGVLSLNTKTIEQVMTKLDYVTMLEANTLLDNEAIYKIAKSGHSRIPIFVDKKENIIGIMLVKNLILLDDSIPTYVRDLDLIKAPHMTTNTNLFDALNFFQLGASHMAIIEKENIDEHESNSNETLNHTIIETNSSKDVRYFNHPEERAIVGTSYQKKRYDFDRNESCSPSNKTSQLSPMAGIVGRKVVGICTLEDIIEEILLEEVVDESDLYTDNSYTTKVVRKPRSERKVFVTKY